MDDLISRQQAIDKINERQRKLIYCFGFENDMVKIMDIAKSIITIMPSAQPEIIRCKDCAYCDSDVVDSPYGMTNKVWWCDRLYAGANENLIVEPDDFCSFAERREDATD